jgi:gliding motility-associated-like protein
VYNLEVPASVLDQTYNWSDLAGNNLGTANPLPITMNGKQIRVLNVRDENNCPFNDTFNINAFDFTYELLKPEIFCNGKTANASIDVDGTVNYSYLWSPADCIVSGGNTKNVVLDVSKQKTIKVKVTHPDLGCTVEDAFQMNPFTVSVNADASPDATIFKGESVDISVTNGQTNWNYEWDNGPKTSGQTVKPEESTTYIVTVTDENGCTGTAEVRIDVEIKTCADDVVLPTAFSPNGDGVNDVLIVRNNTIDELEMIIYSRWGQEMFRTTDPQIGWDGTFNGATLNSDVYAFYIKAKCLDGNEIIKQGNVSLLK